jgi:DNA-directed RNA polymerase subunit RPC12/RpoP
VIKISIKNPKTVNEVIYICDICGRKVSDNQDEWITSFNNCPNCPLGRMKAIEKGGITLFTSNDKKGIQMHNSKYCIDFFCKYTDNNEYDKDTNTLIITINKDIIIDEILQRLTNKCIIQNIEIPNIILKGL